MGAKGDKVTVNKAELISAVAAVRVAVFRSAEQAQEVRNLLKTLTDECLDGERAEAYRSTLDTVAAICDKVASVAEKLARSSQSLCDTLIQELDVARLDQKIMEAAQSTERIHRSKLKGRG